MRKPINNTSNYQFISSREYSQNIVGNMVKPEDFNLINYINIIANLITNVYGESFVPLISNDKERKNEKTIAIYIAKAAQFKYWQQVCNNTDYTVIDGLEKYGLIPIFVSDTNNLREKKISFYRKFTKFGMDTYGYIEKFTKYLINLQYRKKDYQLTYSEMLDALNDFLSKEKDKPKQKIKEKEKES